MSADEFLWLLTQAVFIALFLTTAVSAIRRRRSAEIDTALFFGSAIGIIIISDLERVGAVPQESVLTLSLILVVALPYFLLRLVDDFSVQPAWLMRTAGATVVLLALGAILVGSESRAYVSLPILWVVLLGGYTSLQFLRHARDGRGVTARRMTAVAAGSGMIAALFLLGMVNVVAPDASPAVAIANRILALGAGTAYFIGFSPPALIRRAWQEPELRTFLERAATLPRVRETSAAVREIERAAARATGAQGASVALWDEETDQLVYQTQGGGTASMTSSHGITGRAFTEQRALFVGDATKVDPENAEMYRRYAARAILAAPITSGERRLGVLATFAERAPIFAEDDLHLVQLLADQAAVILENRALVAEGAEVQAREEAARLKDDFLSAAAHDLRTPLTTLLLHAEMLRRRAQQAPDEPLEVRRLDAIMHEGNRLKALVTDLLDAARAERGRLVGEREVVDLRQLALESAQAVAGQHHQLRLDVPEPVMVPVDPDRVRQLLHNLIENAIKYSPEGGEIVITLGVSSGEAVIKVSDRGIGVLPEDLPNLFDRFHRGKNVDDRRFHGLGLGLYICRTIVEEHGGRIWATSEVGRGTTFHVVLPLTDPQIDALEASEAAAAPALSTSVADATGLADA
jgi:signal transduction histidine kinase